MVNETMKIHKPKIPIVIFADGASSGNPGPGGWGAIVATPDGTVTELGGSEHATTNNRMELTAAIRALKHVESFGDPVADPVVLYTDSVYVIRGITQWSFAWVRRGWMTSEGKEVVNRDLWEKLISIVSRRKKLHGSDALSWKYVKGHSGVPGNERADKIAVSFAKGSRLKLYHGPLLRYDVPIYDLSEDVPVPEQKAKITKPDRAYSYLSLVNHVLMRHASWSGCEQRVKGRSGAKFKKVSSQEEERSVLKSWGLDPALLK